MKEIERRVKMKAARAIVERYLNEVFALAPQAPRKLEVRMDGIRFAVDRTFGGRVRVWVPSRKPYTPGGFEMMKDIWPLKKALISALEAGRDIEPQIVEK
jgi:hypothetical protein